MKIALAILAIALTGGAANADVCSRIQAYNATQSHASMKRLPCHCIPLSERADRVSVGGKSPPGFSCGGNGEFYDKQCRLGTLCVSLTGSTPHAKPGRICLNVPSAIPPTTEYIRGHCESKAKGDDTGNPSLDYTCHFPKGAPADCYKDGPCFVCAGLD